MKIQTTQHCFGRTADGRQFSYQDDRTIEALDHDHEVLLRSFVAAGTAVDLDDKDDEPKHEAPAPEHSSPPGPVAGKATTVRPKGPNA
jgi:hypothetical protein